MELLRSINELERIQSPVVLAAGVFDGMHLGHRAVLDAAIESARRIGAEPVVLTFDPHPASILRPETPVHLLTPGDLKLRLIEETGIHTTLSIPFDSEFSRIEPDEFIAKLRIACAQLAGICIGEGWRFGCDRKGDPDMLRILGMKSGFFTSEVPAVRLNGQTVSSTLIRQALMAGDIEKANCYLGRPFIVCGRVIEGAKLGSRLGYPTANIATDERQYPTNGVYVIEARFDGKHHLGVANIGIRPTVTSTPVRVLEAHLFDFQKNLYGSDIEIAFLHHLRSEQTFEGIEALKKRIDLDCTEARQWIMETTSSR